MMKVEESFPATFIADVIELADLMKVSRKDAMIAAVESLLRRVRPEATAPVTRSLTR